MEDNKIIDTLMSILTTEDLWFTQKTDPTFGEAPDYFKLDEYGDLTDASVKKIVKEIKSYIGDGAVDEEDAINIWLQDAMADNKIAYRDILVTKFKDKPVVDGIEAYKNPVQLSEGKKIESIEEVPENAVIKQGMCPYCGSKNLDINEEPEVVEYNDYVSYFWHCKDCGKDGQEIYGMEFLGHDVFQDDENDSYTEFLSKTESKTIKTEGIENTDLIIQMVANDGATDEEISKWLKHIYQTGNYDNINGNYYIIKIIEKSRKYGLTSSYIDDIKYDGDELYYIGTMNFGEAKHFDKNTAIEQGKLLKNKYPKQNVQVIGVNDLSIVDRIDILKENFNISTKDKKEENAKRRLKEENNKSANLISQMMQEKGFDAESNAGKIVLRTSALFNALSEKGYDVQVAFDNGESTSAVLLGEQGGQVLVTITDAQQQLKSFASGNFEVTDDNMAILNNVADIVKTV